MSSCTKHLINTCFYCLFFTIICSDFNAFISAILQLCYHRVAIYTRRVWDSEMSGEKSITHGKPYKMHFLAYCTL